MTASPPSFFLMRQSRLYAIAFFVILAHLFLLQLGTLWNPSPSPPKIPSKVLVQTIHLKPFEKPSAPPAAFPASFIPSKESIPAIQPIKEAPVSEPPPMPEIPIKKEEELAFQEIKPMELAPPTAPAQPVPPVIKKEKPAAPLPAPKPAAVKKSPIEKAAPVKKPMDAKKKNPTAAETEKSKLEIEKQKAKEAEKKRQLEKAEADKKRAQELERKRQQEEAAAEEVKRKQDQLLVAKAKENLAKLNETRSKPPSSTPLFDAAPVPKELTQLHVDAILLEDSGNQEKWSAFEVSYRDEIAFRLKKGLRLPDYGSVKIKITLDRMGKVLKVETLRCENAKNKAYAETTIPSLVFPPFGQRFSELSQNTFAFVLENDL